MLCGGAGEEEGGRYHPLPSAPSPFGPFSAPVPVARAPLTHPSPRSYVKLGVRNSGSLVYQMGIDSEDRVVSVGNIGAVGLRFVDSGNHFGNSGPDGVEEYESISPGSILEGWGAAYTVLDSDGALEEVATSGYATEDTLVNVQGGALVLPPSCDDSSVLPCSSAEATTMVGECLLVKHSFMAVRDLAFRVQVDISNMCEADIGKVLYRRNMDWDVENSAFEEYVTLNAGNAEDLVCLSLDGTCSGDPLQTECNVPTPVPPERTACAEMGTQTKYGPGDLGATFTFDFSNITPETPLRKGGVRTLTAYYGAAATEELAKAELTTLSVEAFSMGSPAAPSLGATHFFAFANITGTPLVFCAEPLVRDDTGLACVCPASSDPCDKGTINGETCACECEDPRSLSGGSCVCNETPCEGGTFDEDTCECVCGDGEMLVGGECTADIRPSCLCEEASSSTTGRSVGLYFEGTGVCA